MRSGCAAKWFSYLYTVFFTFSSLTCYYQILTRAPCATVGPSGFICFLYTVNPTFREYLGFITTFSRILWNKWPESSTNIFTKGETEASPAAAVYLGQSATLLGTGLQATSMSLVHPGELHPPTPPPTATLHPPTLPFSTPLQPPPSLCVLSTDCEASCLLSRQRAVSQRARLRERLRMSPEE